MSGYFLELTLSRGGVEVELDLSIMQQNQI